MLYNCSSLSAQLCWRFYNMFMDIHIVCSFFRSGNFLSVSFADSGIRFGFALVPGSPLYLPQRHMLAPFGCGLTPCSPLSRFPWRARVPLRFVDPRSLRRPQPHPARLLASWTPLSGSWWLLLFCGRLRLRLGRRVGWTRNLGRTFARMF